MTVRFFNLWNQWRMLAFYLILYFNFLPFLQVQLLDWWAAVRVQEPGCELHHVRRSGPLGGQDQPLRSLLGRRHWSQRICRSRWSAKQIFKGYCSVTRFFASGFFHESSSLKPLKINVQMFSKIRGGDIRRSRAPTINDTGGEPWAANISANFRDNLKRS